MTLKTENAVAFVGHYQEAMDRVYTNLPVRNVVNTQIGYDLYNAGRIGNGH